MNLNLCFFFCKQIDILSASKNLLNLKNIYYQTPSYAWDVKMGNYFFPKSVYCVFRQSDNSCLYLHSVRNLESPWHFYCSPRLFLFFIENLNINFVVILIKIYYFVVQDGSRLVNLNIE